MASDNIQGLETMDAWKRSKDFAVKVCKEVLPLLPAEEKWSLGQQIRRAVQSVPANIVEGHGRFYFQETIRFCYIARGSLSETYTHLVLAHEMGYIPQTNYVDLRKQVEDLIRIINGYIAYLNARKSEQTNPARLTRLGKTLLLIPSIILKIRNLQKINKPIPLFTISYSP